MVLRLLALCPLLIAATAHAQAPGDTELAPPSAVPLDSGSGGCSHAIHEPVIANRWALGFSLGSLAVAPEGSPNNKTQFAVGELALRFRATPHLELELGAGGGREQLSDGSQGDRQVNTVTLAARYRFSIEHAWNWWLMAGFGGYAVAAPGASDAVLKANERPLGEAGIGIERRFRRFALQAELRGISVGPPQHDQVTKAPPTTVMAGSGTGGQPAPGGQPPSPYMGSDKQTGGVMTIGASYYF